MSWLEVFVLSSSSPQLFLLCSYICAVYDLDCQTEELVIGDLIKTEELTVKAETKTTRSPSHTAV